MVGDVIFNFFKKNVVKQSKFTFFLDNDTWPHSGPFFWQNCLFSFWSWFGWCSRIYFFNFVSTPNKSLTFTRFKRSYVNRTVVVLTNHCQSYTAFFAWCALFRKVNFLFLQLFVPNDSAFAEPIFVERMCCSNVVNSKVGKQTTWYEIVTHKNINTYTSS